MRVISGQSQGGILTAVLDRPTVKQGQLVTIDFERETITGKIIKKLGNTIKIRISKIESNRRKV